MKTNKQTVVGFRPARHLVLATVMLSLFLGVGAVVMSCSVDLAQSGGPGGIRGLQASQTAEQKAEQKADQKTSRADSASVKKKERK